MHVHHVGDVLPTPAVPAHPANQADSLGIAVPGLVPRAPTFPTPGTLFFCLRMATCRTTSCGRPRSRPPNVRWRAPRCEACLMRGASTLRPVPLCCVVLLAFYSFSFWMAATRIAVSCFSADVHPPLLFLEVGARGMLWSALRVRSVAVLWCTQEHTPHRRSTVHVLTAVVEAKSCAMPRCTVVKNTRTRTRLASDKWPERQCLDALKALRFLSRKTTPP